MKFLKLVGLLSVGLMSCNSYCSSEEDIEDMGNTITRGIVYASESPAAQAWKAVDQTPFPLEETKEAAVRRCNLAQYGFVFAKEWGAGDCFDVLNALFVYSKLKQGDIKLANDSTVWRAAIESGSKEFIAHLLYKGIDKEWLDGNVSQIATELGRCDLLEILARK